MALLWYPDFCPSTPGCVLETDQGQYNLIVARRLCAHHQSLKDGGLTDAQVFRAVRETTNAKERARWAIKVELMRTGEVDKEWPGVPYTVDPDGTIRIQTGEVNPVRRAKLAALAAAEVAKVVQAPGIAAVIVE